LNNEQKILAYQSARRPARKKPPVEDYIWPITWAGLFSVFVAALAFFIGGQGGGFFGYFGTLGVGEVIAILLLLDEEFRLFAYGTIVGIPLAGVGVPVLLISNFHGC